MISAFRAALAAVLFLLALPTGCGQIEDGEPSGPIPTPDAGATRTTKGALGESCNIPSDCDSAQCFIGGQSSYCSLKCGTDTATTICVPPVFNGMCNKQGFCRKP